MIEAVWIAFAFVLGVIMRQAGLPPLIGYLGAGFALAGFGDVFGAQPQDSAVLAHIAHLGVLLLLFTVGLKLKLKNLIRPEVIGGSLLHFGLSVIVYLPGLLLFLDIETREALLPTRCMNDSPTG